jgi:hypothetical protein
VSPTPESKAQSRPKERTWPYIALFALALLLHGWWATTNFSSRFLAGHEFRQAQTAISTTFIVRDQDFSLAYPTPLFGQPWSIPMEFPLYQWTSALVTMGTDLTVVESSRLVGLLCFYLSLPALLLLLKALRPEDRVGPWFALILIVCAPAYLFYSRAVLIESMALMFSVWFLWAFVRMCQTARFGWAVAASGLGALAALVKVTTFAAWCMPAAVGGLWWSWHQRQSKGPAAWRRSVALGAVSAILPAGLSWWWVRTADAIKQSSIATEWLTSENLQSFNLGTWADRMNWQLWAQVGEHIDQVLSPGWFILGGGMLGWWVARRSGKRQIVLPLMAFVGSIALFPVLYSFHDYYLFANGFFLLTAGGLILAELRHRPNGVWLSPLLLVVGATAQLFSYSNHYLPQQKVVSDGGSLLTELIRDTFPPDEVILVMGVDWSAAVPFYMERKAFLVRDVLGRNPDRFKRELQAGLDGEMIGGLLVRGMPTGYEAMMKILVEDYGIDPDHLMELNGEKLHVLAARTNSMQFRISRDANHRDYLAPGKRVSETNDFRFINDSSYQALSEAEADSLFPISTPRPHHYQTQFDLESVLVGDHVVVTAHPDSELWITPPANARRVSIEFGMRPESYERDESRSDGVVFSVKGVFADGNETTLFERGLEPNSRKSDQGLQAASFELPSPAPVELVFSTGPLGHHSFDWAYWKLILVE